MSDYTATLGGVEFGTSGPYVLEEITGWDSAASTGSVETRVGARGGWPTKAYLAPRLPTVKGRIVLGPGDSMESAIDTLLNAIPLDSFGPLTVTRDGGSRFVNVRQDGEPDVSIVTKKVATFAIPLIAADPLKYASTQGSTTIKLPSVSGGLALPMTVPFSINAAPTSGTFTAVNGGNFPAPFKVTVYGPADHPTITNSTTGESVTYNGTIDAGHYLVIDLDARTALLDGESSRRGFLKGRFFPLQPGPNSIGFTAGFFNPDAHALIEWRDTWR